MTDADVLALFERSGALKRGHFILTSGRHSDTYFEKFDVLNQPVQVATLCQELAARCAGFAPEVVLGPTTLGVLLAYEVARGLGVTAAYGEKAADGSRFLRRPEHLRAGQRVLVVDDILTTGGSIRECIDLVERVGATLCGVGVLVDRSGGQARFSAPTVALLSMVVQSYPPEGLPDWLAAIPVTRPGSTGKK